MKGEGGGKREWKEWKGGRGTWAISVARWLMGSILEEPLSSTYMLTPTGGEREREVREGEWEGEVLCGYLEV